jgi:hypothetical protein
MELRDIMDSPAERAADSSRIWKVLATARASYLSAVSPHYDEGFGR